MSSDDNTSEQGGDAVDSFGDTVASDTSSGTESTVMAPTAPPDDSSIPADRGAVSASFPVADRGRYAIEGEHARGGLGRVLRAHDRRLNRPVAIKELLQASDGAEARFLREAVVTARLEHPSIVPVHDMGRWSGGAPFYAMKMVSGRSLEQCFNQAGTLAERLALLPNLVAVADAMAYAHSKGVIHRDLKPGNVIVGEFGETIVIDWGLAKDQELADDLDTLDPALQVAAEGLTMVGSVMGTPAYMPPEQAAGETVDERADVYALGAMLYQLLAGRPPYAGDRSADVLARVNAGPPAALDAKELEAPVELVAICDKAMARELDRRYTTAAELVDDLKRFQRGQLVTAHAYSAWSHVRRWLARYRAPVAVAAVGLVVLLALGIVSVRRIVAEKRTAQTERADAEHQRRAADEQRQVAERRALQLLQEQGRRELLAQRPLRALVYLSRAYSGGASSPRLRMLVRDAMRYVDGLQATLAGHTGAITAVAWSPDGRHIVSTSSDKTVRVWDVAGKKQVGELVGHAGAVRDVAWSPDSKRIITAGRDGVAKVWDATRFRVLHTLKGHKGGVQSARVSPHGDRYVTAGNDGTFKLWAADGSLVRSVHGDGPLLQGAEFDASGKRLITAGLKSGQLWNADTGELVHTFAGHTQLVFGARLSPDGSRAITTSFDKTAKLWDTSSGKLVATLPGAGPIQHAAFSPSSDVVVTADRGGGCVMWDAGDGRKLRALPHSEIVWRVAFSPDGKWLATASSDGARLWDGKTGGLIARLPSQLKVVRYVRFSPDAKLLLVAGDSGAIRLWRTDAWKLRATLATIASGVRFDAAGTRLITTAHNGRATIWAARTFKRLRVLDGSPKQKIGSTAITSEMTQKQVLAAMHNMMLARALIVRDAFFSPDGKRVVTITSDPDVRVWNPQTGALLHTLRGHKGTITSAELSPDGALLATASVDGTVGVWDMRRARLVRQLRPGTKRISRVAFRPDGKVLASVGDDVRVRLWDVATGDQLRVIEGHRRDIRDLRWSPDGRNLLTASNDGTARIWNASTGAQRLELRHRKRVSSARYSSDGKRIITASDDHTAKIWDAATGAMMLSFDDHTGPVVLAVLSPDGTLAATLSRDGTVKLWDASGGQLIMTLRSHNAPVSAAAFRPDGGSLVTVSVNGAAMVWDLSTEQRPPATIAAIVTKAAPWTLHNGRLMPKN